MSTRFSYQDEEICELERGFSPERFARYVRLAAGDRPLAVRMYEGNIALSVAMYGVIQGLEISLRNSIHRTLSRERGENWFDSITVLAEPLLLKIEEARRNIARDGKSPTPSRVVAELSFGFWTALTTKRYEGDLWMPYLRRAFPNALRPNMSSERKNGVAARLSRREISDRLNSIRILRNRIAHHESVLHLMIQPTYVETLEATAWICPVTAAWIEQTNAYPQSAASFSDVLEIAKIARESPETLASRPATQH